MINHGNHPSVRRSQGFTADREFMCDHCGAQARLLQTDCRGVDDEGNPDIYPEYKVLCTVCDTDHSEFTVDAFLAEIRDVQQNARQYCLDQMPAGQYDHCVKTGDWGPYNEKYFAEVYRLLLLIADGLPGDALVLFHEVAESFGWSLNSDLSIEEAEEPENFEDDDYNMLAEGEADFEEERDFAHAITTLSSALACLRAPTMNHSFPS